MSPFLFCGLGHDRQKRQFEKCYGCVKNTAELLYLQLFFIVKRLLDYYYVCRKRSIKSQDKSLIYSTHVACVNVEHF